MGKGTTTVAWGTVANIKGPPGTGTSGVSSAFGRTGDVVAVANDYTFAQIGSKPTTLAGYGITDPVVLTSGSYSNPAWITALAWSKITGAPTTLSGYGITDAQPLDADLTAIAALATTSFGRGGLTQADAASFRSYIGAGTSTVTPAALTKTDDTNVTLALGGTPATALLQAASLTLGWTGTLAVARGGLGTGTYTLGDVIYSDAANSLAKLGGNTTSTKKFLRQTGTGTVSAAPAWDTIVAADVPGSALTKTDDTNVTLTLGGSPTTALLNAASITLGWTGTLAAGRLNANVVQAVTNDTNITGSIATQTLTLGWTGTLALARGGTGGATFAANTFFGNNTASTAAAAFNAMAALTKTDDTNVTLTLGGSPSTALLNAASLTLGWTGTLAIARGGTGASTATTALSNLGGEPALGNPATDGYILTSTAAGVRSWLAPGSASGGLPTGGTVGQRLFKNSGTDYDAIWRGLNWNSNNSGSQTTTSTTGAHMGMGILLTPRTSGVVMLVYAGFSANSAVTTVGLQFRFGTGTAPALNAAATGTIVGAAMTLSVPTANYQENHSFTYIGSGFTLGTQYWFDVVKFVGAGTGTWNTPFMYAIEL